MTGMWVSPNAFVIEPTLGILQLVLNHFAQDGGAVITLGSNNPSAFPLPQTLTIPTSRRHSTWGRRMRTYRRRSR